VGNSSIEFLKPDIVIFIFGNDNERRETGVERPDATLNVIELRVL
jgi:hypothetical protein